MADPPDDPPTQLHVYGSLSGQGYDDGSFCNEAGCLPEDLLQTHIDAKQCSQHVDTRPKWMPSLCNTASPAHLTQFANRHRTKRPDVPRNESPNDSALVTRERGWFPQASPLAAPSDVTATRLGRLSLGQAQEAATVHPTPGDRVSPLSRKRPASSDLEATYTVLGRSAAAGWAPAMRGSIVSKCRKPAVEYTACASQRDGRTMLACARARSSQHVGHDPRMQSEDSTPPSLRMNVREDRWDPAQYSSIPTPMSNGSRIGPSEQSPIRDLPTRSLPYSDSKPISYEQLAAEIKGIYAALAMVEAKCIKLDNAQMARSGNTADLPHEQWQALIALHRTLLYEHHDFLSASQHPSTNSSLRKLPTKYSMPARMWKYGIHAFLEVLRRRLPESLDYMLQFIYMAYQMVALLYETIPSFQDTWIECLGDLARYRMAIEEQDMRDREIWGGVARDWYSKSSNRNPDVGRLYHHLGILARPNAVQQVYFYCRSLTCVQPFDSAMESLTALLSPLKTADSGRPVMPHVDETDSMLLYLHAILLCTRSTKTRVKSPVSPSAYHSRLDGQIRKQALKWKDHGVFIAVANISACFEYGCTNNYLDMVYRKSHKDVDFSKVDFALDGPMKLLSDTFAVVLCQEKDYNVLPHVHTILAFLWSIYNLAVSEAAAVARFLKSIPWSKIVDFLNSFIRSEPIEERVADAGRRGRFLNKDSKPLPEDYLLRGLVWCQDYFVSGWFDERHDEESRLLELPTTNKVRIERVLRLSICLSQKGRFITFDHSRKQFLKLN